MTFLATLAIAALSLLALACGLQRRLVYFPGPGPVPPAARVLPGAVDVRLETEDGLSLGAWWVPARGGASRATILVFDGNAGHRGDRAPLAGALASRGFAVLLFDYRGYGGNPGSPSEEGFLRDARAARAYLERRGDVDASRLVFFGESLGAAVAVAAAAERPPATLVLRSPFTSLADVGEVHYPFLPVRLLLRDRYPSLERIRRVTCPLLVVAGSRDGVIPPSQSRALFEAGPVTAKRFVLAQDADHNDPLFLDGDAFVGAVVRFLEESLPGGRGG